MLQSLAPETCLKSSCVQRQRLQPYLPLPSELCSHQNSVCAPQYTSFPFVWLDLFGSVSPNPATTSTSVLLARSQTLPSSLLHPSSFLLSRSKSHQMCISFSSPHLKPCSPEVSVGQPPLILTHSDFSGTPSPTAVPTQLQH